MRPLRARIAVFHQIPDAAGRDRAHHRITLALESILAGENGRSFEISEGIGVLCHSEQNYEIALLPDVLVTH